MANLLVKRAKDIFQRLRSRLSALKNTLVPQRPSEKAKPKASSSSPSQKGSRKK